MQNLKSKFCTKKHICISITLGSVVKKGFILGTSKLLSKIQILVGIFLTHGYFVDCELYKCPKTECFNVHMFYFIFLIFQKQKFNVKLSLFLVMFQTSKDVKKYLQGKTQKITSV